MADVRALLKAKRQEARITHPYATYTTAGQLKCTVCSAVVKHASAWEGHLGSKQHRTNVIRMREEEKRQREQQARMEEEQEEEEESMEREPKPETAGKRKATTVGESETPAEKKRKVEAQAKGSQSFPQDFFSDPSRAPASLLSPDSEDEDEDEEGEASQPAPPTSNPKATVVDLEYERFQRELMSSATTTDPTEAYARATVAAEPVAASTDIAGFPPAEPDAAEPEAPQLTEDELRRKREEDERELIMDRLLEEERAQEDADTRVLLLKTKLDNLRRKRELAKTNKAPK